MYAVALLSSPILTHMAENSLNIQNKKEDLGQIVMSGIRPTGFLHLGNYFGAIRNYIRMQENFTCYFMVADLHSLTTHPDTKQLKTQVHRVLAENIACGLDPDKATIYCQSHKRNGNSRRLAEQGADKKERG